MVFCALLREQSFWPDVFRNVFQIKTSDAITRVDRKVFNICLPIGKAAEFWIDGVEIVF